MSGIAAYDAFDPLFNSLSPLLRLGNERPLENEDIGLLREKDCVEISEKEFTKFWGKELELPPAQRSLRRAIFRTVNWFEIVLAVLLYFAFSASNFSGPLILNALLDHLSGKKELAEHVLIILVMFIFLAPMIGVILKEQADLLLDRMGLRLRNALVAVVFSKSLRLSPVARQANSGTINNIFSNDTKQLADAVTGFPVLFSPLQVGVGLYLIYRQVGPAAFAGLAYMLACMPFLIFCGAMFGILVKRKLIHSDGRVKLTSEFFSGIRVLKYYAWEKPFAAKLEGFRAKEMVEIAKIYYNFIMLTLLIESLPTIQPVLIYYTYTRLGNELTYTTAFTALTLFMSIQGPLQQIPNIFTLSAYVINATKRILNVLNEEEIVEYRERSPCSDHPDDVIVVESASFAWLKEEECQPFQDKAADSSYELAPMNEMEKEVDNEIEDKCEDNEIVGINRGLNTITNTSFRVPRGSLVGILGPVGSGKSSLLNGLLGEIYLTGGSVRIVGSTSYHQQQPWILNMSLKENVLFGLPYDEAKFKAVLEASALVPDLVTLPSGADTEIGEKGITLSGGQKARVSFARSLYCSADITLLDDPLSAVDAHTCEHLWSKGVKGMLKNAKKTTLVVTHQVHLLSDCDLLIVLNADGVTKRVCTYNDLSKQELDEIFHAHGALPENVQNGFSWLLSSPSSSSSVSISAKSKRGSERNSKQVESEKKNEKDSELMTNEDRQIGFVPLDVYKWFVRTGGLCYILGMALVLFIGSAVNAASTFYLSYWGGINADAEAAGSTVSEARNLKYVNTYACIQLVSLCIGAIGRYLSSLHAIEVGGRLHSLMLTRVLQAPISFFDTTPLGRIVNRFSGDIGTADMGLSAFLGIVFSLICNLLMCFISVAIATQGILLVVLVPLALIYYRVQLYFRKSNTEVRRLGSIAKSPVFTQISQALSGTTCIRAFKEQPTFMGKLQKHMDRYSSIWLIERKMNSWISLRIQFLGASIAFFVVLLAIYGKGYVNPESLAVALTYCFIIPTLFGIIMGMGAEMEAMMSSVERIRYFSDEVPIEENPTHTELVQVPESWPDQGHIQARDVKMRYRDGPLVLKGISFEVKSSSKVGLAGRTGSGKSSLLVALFRMEKIENGELLIDGIDISRVNLQTLRSRLSIIPQDPVMFCATLRFNLDPFDQFTDEKIWGVLEDVQMKQTVKDMPFQLQTEITEDGENLSVGQRQLVCFARALLRRPKIVVLDEATAAVDNATDAIIQKMVKEKLKDCTLLTIAHRLHTIMDSDKILVLDKGILVEEDVPGALISKWGGVFAGMWAQHRSSHNK